MVSTAFGLLFRQNISQKCVSCESIRTLNSQSVLKTFHEQDERGLGLLMMFRQIYQLAFVYRRTHIHMLTHGFSNFKQFAVSDPQLDFVPAWRNSQLAKVNA